MYTGEVQDLSYFWCLLNNMLKIVKAFLFYYPALFLSYFVVVSLLIVNYNYICKLRFLRNGEQNRDFADELLELSLFFKTF